MENIARSLVQRIPLPWDLRWAVLFPFILAGNGRRCSEKSPASRARLRITTICSTAFPQNQNEDFGFISIAAGQTITTNLRVACEIGCSGKDTAVAPSSSTLLFRRLSMTRTHGLRVVRSPSSSSSGTCQGSQNRDDPRLGRLRLLFVVRVPKALTKIVSPAVGKG